ncbi:serine/threonine-protein kinase VRK1 [Rhipicephalus sanguineus]|nr:serine/threonine-protein kinase VRK1 [Rhipicephalus sanguineus]
MVTFGEDLQKSFGRQGKTLSLKFAFSLGMPVIDVLDYVHSYEYIHALADMEESSVLGCFRKDNGNNLYLQDFGFAYRYTQNGKRKEYMDDRTKVHYGTIEFVCRDVRIGAHSRKSDAKLLVYNVFQWISCRLPWKDNLMDPEHVSEQRNKLMENMPLLMSKCLPHGNIPCSITKLLQYAVPIKFEDSEHYKRRNRVSQKGIHTACFKPRSGLRFMPPRTQRRKWFSPKKPMLQEIILAEDSMGESGDENVMEKSQQSKVATTPATTPLWKRKHRSPAVTKSASWPHGVVKLEPKRKPVKKNAASSLSGWTCCKGSR